MSLHWLFLHVSTSFPRFYMVLLKPGCVGVWKNDGDHCQRPGQPNHSILCGFYRYRATYWWCRQESGGTQSWEHCRLFDNTWQIILGNCNVKDDLGHCKTVDDHDGPWYTAHVTTKSWAMLGNVGQWYVRKRSCLHFSQKHLRCLGSRLVF